MIKVSKVAKYIEKLYGIRLMDVQKDCLKHIIAGDLIYTPRCFGRSMLYQGYASYLSNVEAPIVDYTVDPLDFDKVYTYADVPRGALYSNELLECCKEQNIDTFNREYCGKYTV